MESGNLLGNIWFSSVLILGFILAFPEIFGKDILATLGPPIIGTAITKLGF